jgi:fatty acid desaturase
LYEQPKSASSAEPRLARQVQELTADLGRANPWIYWSDLLASAGVTYGCLAVAIFSQDLALRLAASLICVFSLYRAVSFIHELTHQQSHELPGFHFAWNLLIGVPFLAPSFMYEGVHNQHHVQSRYGTSRDPEYLPLAHYPAHKIALFIVSALLAPVALAFRFAVVTPLSFLIPPLRRAAVGRMSAMSINPGFVREDARRAASPAWLAQEIGCWLWSWTLIAAAVSGRLPQDAWIALAILAVTTFVNQLRTVGAHYWENAGEKMSFEAQFHDSVNAPPPALLPALWAPVGLRYHALHHLAPRLPYHALGEAHRRLSASLPPEADYRGVDQKSLTGVIAGLFRRAKAHRNARTA